MRLPIVVSAVALTLTLSMPAPSGGQAAPKDSRRRFRPRRRRSAVGPVLARLRPRRRPGARDCRHRWRTRRSYTSIPRGPELARVRSEEMQCATKALGTQPPVQLGFPDGELGHYAADPSRLVQLGMRAARGTAAAPPRRARHLGRRRRTAAPGPQAGERRRHSAGTCRRTWSARTSLLCSIRLKGCA